MLDTGVLVLVPPLEELGRLNRALLDRDPVGTTEAFQGYVGVLVAESPFGHRIKE